MHAVPRDQAAIEPGAHPLVCAAEALHQFSCPLPSRRSANESASSGQSLRSRRGALDAWSGSSRLTNAFFGGCNGQSRREDKRWCTSTRSYPRQCIQTTSTECKRHKTRHARGRRCCGASQARGASCRALSGVAAGESWALACAAFRRRSYRSTTRIERSSGAAGLCVGALEPLLTARYLTWTHSWYKRRCAVCVPRTSVLCLVPRIRGLLRTSPPQVQQPAPVRRVSAESLGSLAGWAPARPRRCCRVGAPDGRYRPAADSMVRARRAPLSRRVLSPSPSCISRGALRGAQRVVGFFFCPVVRPSGALHLGANDAEQPAARNSRAASERIEQSVLRERRKHVRRRAWGTVVPRSPFEWRAKLADGKRAGGSSARISRIRYRQRR